MKQDSSTISNVALNFISKYRNIIFGSLLLIVVGFIGLGIYALIDYQSKMEAIATVDRAFIRYEKWLSLEENAPQYSELEGEIQNILNSFLLPRSEGYAGAKALWILSEMEGKKGNLEKQKDYLLKILDWYPNSHRNISASYKLVELYLNENETEKAKKILEELLKNPDLPALFKEEIMFSLGVLSEKTDLTLAKNYYNNLILTYPMSDWTKLARSRIISLELVE